MKKLNLSCFGECGETTCWVSDNRQASWRAKPEQWYSRWRALGTQSPAAADSWYILGVYEVLTQKEYGIHLTSPCQGGSLLYDKAEQELFGTCSYKFLHLFGRSSFCRGGTLLPLRLIHQSWSYSWNHRNHN